MLSIEGSCDEKVQILSLI